MKLPKRMKSPAFAALCLATLGFVAYTSSLFGGIGFFLIFGAPYFFMTDLPPYATLSERISQYVFLLVCTLIFVFLITPILVIMPLSFNAEPYFTFTDGMLAFDSSAYSLRWYEDIFGFGMTNPNATGSSWWQDMWNNSVWIGAFRNSFFIAIMATLLATGFGTLAALGLSRPEMPFRTAITSLLI